MGIGPWPVPSLANNDATPDQNGYWLSSSGSFKGQDKQKDNGTVAQDTKGGEKRRRWGGM